jgi:transposase
MPFVDEDRLKWHDLMDGERARLEPLLPGHPRQGHWRNDHRMVIDAVFFRTRAGCPWLICRGGLTAQVHLPADPRCQPLARVTSSGQRHDSLAFVALMDGW